MKSAAELINHKSKYQLKRKGNSNSVIFNAEDNGYTCDIFDNRLPYESLLLAQSIENKEKPQCVLDVGTGTGIILLEICKNNNISFARGVDIDSKKIEKAKKNIIKNGLENKCDVSCCSFQSLGRRDVCMNSTIVCNPPLVPGEYGFLTRTIGNSIIPTYCSFIEWSSKNVSDSTVIYMHIFDYIDSPNKYYSSFLGYLNKYHYVVSDRVRFIKNVLPESQVFKRREDIVRWYPYSKIWYEGRDILFSDYIHAKKTNGFIIQCSILRLTRAM